MLPKTELLAIVETLKEFQGMLWGQTIKVYTDHKNLTFDTFTLQRVLRWRTACEDYSPKLIHVVGVKNIVADQFSRLERHDDDHSSQSLVGEKTPLSLLNNNSQNASNITKNNMLRIFCINYQSFVLLSGE